MIEKKIGVVTKWIEFDFIGHGIQIRDVASTISSLIYKTQHRFQACKTRLLFHTPGNLMNVMEKHLFLVHSKYRKIELRENMLN